MVIMCKPRCKLPRNPSTGALQYKLGGELLRMLVGRVRRTRRTRTCRPLAQTMYRGERNVIRVTDPGSVDRPCGSVLIGVCDRDIVREGPFM